MLSNAGVAILSLALTAPQLTRVPNLLINPSASEDTSGWKLFMGATIDECEKRDRCFVVHDRAAFQQQFSLPADAAGQYVLMIGFAKADRVDPSAGITDRPYLHVIFKNADASRFLYTKQMIGNAVHSSSSTSEWQRIWAVYQVPEGAASGQLTLALGSRQGVDHDGSVGRLDDVGVFLFRTGAEAKAFVTGYSRR